MHHEDSQQLSTQNVSLVFSLTVPYVPIVKESLSMVTV